MCQHFFAHFFHKRNPQNRFSSQAHPQIFPAVESSTMQKAIQINERVVSQTDGQTVMYCAEVQAFISTSNTYIQRRQTNRFKESALSKQQSETSILTLSPARFLHIDLKPHNGHRKLAAVKPIFQVQRLLSVYPPRAKINYHSLNNICLHLIPLRSLKLRRFGGREM
jgi:hypothetical protein